MVLCLGLTIVLVTGLAGARSTSGKSAQSKQAKQITCTGKVVDDQGKPVTDAQVTLYRLTVSLEQASYEIKLAKEVTTKEDGTFAIKNEAGSDELSAQAFILAQKEGLALGWTNWRLLENLDTEIKLGPANVLAGKVVDENQKPVADAEVGIAFMFLRTNGQPQFMMGDMALKLLTARTNNEGKFSFSQIPAEASAELLVKKPGRATVSTFNPQNFQGQSLQFSPGQTDIKLIQPVEAEIEGMVVEKASGKPVAGIQIMVTKGLNQPSFGRKPVVSGEDGTFSINALGPGKHFLMTVTPTGKTADWITGPVEVVTETGKTKSGIKVELSKGGLLEVVVIEAVSKKPVEKANVVILPQGGNRASGSITDEDGIARIRLMPGEYRMVQVYKQGYSRDRRQESVTIEDGKTEHIEYELTDQPKITGVVRDEKGKPLKGVKLKVRPMGGSEDVTSDADGKFEALYDPANWPSETTAFILVCRYEEGNLAAAVQIDEDARELDITLKSGVIFTGKVVDPDGKGITNARILLMLRGPRWTSTIERNIETDAEGNFEIKAIPPEQKYRITANAEGYGQNRTEEISAEDAVDNQLSVGELKLPLANLTVSGVVVDDEDKPVAGARISCYGDNQPSRRTQTDTDGKFTLDKICAGRMRISANKSGETRLYGSIETEGGATDVQIVISQRSTSTRYEPKRPPSLIGRPLPELKDVKVEIPSSDADGKMILVCFWDMEQRPSRYCIMQLAKQAEQLKQQGIIVVAVQASKIDENKLNDWVKKYNIPFAVGMVEGDEEKTRFTWGVRSLPWLILTDRKHVIRSGGFGINDLNEKIGGITKVEP
jgi:protocatechuate 3,4-dioxygenase beta subunit